MTQRRDTHARSWGVGKILADLPRGAREEKAVYAAYVVSTAEAMIINLHLAKHDMCTARGHTRLVTTARPYLLGKREMRNTDQQYELVHTNDTARSRVLRAVSTTSGRCRRARIARVAASYGQPLSRKPRSGPAPQKLVPVFGTAVSRAGEVDSVK